jgi:hypothetical protein
MTRLPAIADLLLDRALPPQRRGQRRRLAGRYRAARPMPKSGLRQMRDDRRQRAAELARPIGIGEPDRRALALKIRSGPLAGG